MIFPGACAFPSSKLSTPASQAACDIAGEQHYPITPPPKKKALRYWLLEAEVHQKGGRSWTQNCLKGSTGIWVEQLSHSPSLSSTESNLSVKTVNSNSKYIFILNSAERCSQSINHIVSFLGLEYNPNSSYSSSGSALFSSAYMSHSSLIFSSRV